MTDGLGRLRNDMVLGFMLLTRLPMPSLAHYDKDALARSIWTYPIVGAVVGAGSAGALAGALALGLPAVAAATIALAVLVLLTGCFHEDGLADFWDGIGGGRTVERKLEIMRDSRIGSYGATALILMFVCRIALIAGLAERYGPGQGAAAIVAAGLLGRSAIAGVLLVIGPARSDGLTATAHNPPLWSGVAALSLALLVFVLLPPVAAIVAIAAAAGVVLIMATLMQRQIQGFVGDGLGATEVKVELAVLAAVTSVLAASPLG